MSKIYLPTSELTSYDNYHRYGWKFVINNLYNLDIIAKQTNTYDPSTDSSLTLLLGYIDKEFHWNYTANKEANIVPYTRNWIGFLHHPFDPTFSVYNSTALFENQDFIDSLMYCKGIFVLSQSLANDTQLALGQLSCIDEKYSNYINIPVNALVHPTGDVDASLMFNVQHFSNNPDQKLIQIGSWLRDAYSIYKFPDISILGLQKAVLIGPDMENIKKPIHFFNHIKELISQIEPSTSVLDDEDDIEFENPVCRDVDDSLFSGNRYVKGVFDHLKKLDSQVVEIDLVSDADYDDLLSKNIIYIQLTDAVAVNTVIECIMRNTPILINPLPAIVEILGASYPFYYDQYNQTDALQNIYNLFSLRKLQSVVNYMRNIDKSQFSIDSFTSTFSSSDIVSCL